MSDHDINKIIREIQKNRSDQEIVHARMQEQMTLLADKTDTMYNIFVKGSAFITVLKWLGIIAGSITAIIVTFKQIK